MKALTVKVLSNPRQRLIGEALFGTSQPGLSASERKLIENLLSVPRAIFMVLLVCIRSCCREVMMGSFGRAILPKKPRKQGSFGNEKAPTCGYLMGQFVP
jgi:hypothetical protein